MFQKPSPQGATWFLELPCSANVCIGPKKMFTTITFEKSTENEELFFRVQRMAKIGAWTMHLAEKRLECSEEVGNIFEIDPETFDISYQTFLNAIHPDDRESINAAYLDMLLSKKPCSIEHRLLLKNGQVKYVREECETDFDTNAPH